LYLFLGGDTVIRSDEVVAIFDLDKTSTGPITREFLANAEREMRVTNVAGDLPRSFLVCEDDTGTRVYLSQIAAATLKKRAGFLESLRDRSEPSR
jgi:hypothetical protein